MSTEFHDSVSSPENTQHFIKTSTRLPTLKVSKKIGILQVNYNLYLPPMEVSLSSRTPSSLCIPIVLLLIAFEVWGKIMFSQVFVCSQGWGWGGCLVRGSPTFHHFSEGSPIFHHFSEGSPIFHHFSEGSPIFL